MAYHAGRIRRGDPVRRRGATIDRRAIMTTLGCAGLRAHELCDLNVDDVDLVHDRLSIRDTKTAAGVRYVYLTPKLNGSWRATSPSGAGRRASRSSPPRPVAGDARQPA